MLNIFGPGWTGILENTSFIWSKTDKHAKCIYYFQNVFSHIKRNLRKPDVFKFTRFEAGICDERLPEVSRLKQPVLSNALA